MTKFLLLRLNEMLIDLQSDQEDYERFMEAEPSGSHERIVYGVQAKMLKEFRKDLTEAITMGTGEDIDSIQETRARYLYALEKLR